MPVQQHILNWLYSVLTSEYHDVNRTYNDVAQALAQYPSLSPRTDVHTFDNGSSALLLHLSGTIPVVFRGVTYRIPISLWVPHAYPREAPLAYVTPTENMMVRPGQHVDPQGQVYHPYLVGWSQFWDKSSILDFLAILRDIFAKEPPVIARRQAGPPPPPAQHQHQPQHQPQHRHQPSPPPVPPLPPDLARRPPSHVDSPVADQARAPPPPPKSHEQPRYQPTPTPPLASRPDGPPLPPLPAELQRPAGQYGAGMLQGMPQPPQSQSRYDSAPPLPPQGNIPRTQSQTGPSAHVPAPHHQPGPAQPPPQQISPQPGFSPQNQRGIFTPNHQAGYAGPPPPWQRGALTLQHQPPPAPAPKPPPPPDLLDEPLTLSIPTAPAPAPPIPPNPEKDLLLRRLAQTLHSMRQHAAQQNASSLAGLAAQRGAMQSARAALQSDSSALTQMSALLSANAAALHEALRAADGVVERSARQPAPQVDELLVAPTVVANQLYDLVAEERALGDAIFVLGRAVERGRIAPGTFTKTTRSLAREWYLKKALVKKIGRGMGLAA